MYGFELDITTDLQHSVVAFILEASVSDSDMPIPSVLFATQYIS